MNTNRGVMINLEGGDASGKTTSLPFIKALLLDAKFDVVLSRAPGGSKTAELIRGVLLGTKLEEPMCARAELLMFAASRAQTYEAQIKPALEQGQVVLSDRFADSAYAYQGFARNQTVEARLCEQIAHPGFTPDVTLFFDITNEESFARQVLRRKEYNRLNEEDWHFKGRCHQGYQVIKELDRPGLKVINGMQDIEGVRNDLRVWFNEEFLPQHQHLIQS